MGVNLIAKKEIRKTSLVLWAVSFALLMQARPLWAMNDQSGTLNVIQGTKGLRDHDYYKAELQKLEDSTRRIHQEVNRILKEFKENMEEYRKHTRGKGIAQVITKKPRSREEIAQQMRLDEAITLAMSEGLEGDNFMATLQVVLSDNPKMGPREAIDEAAIEMTKQQQGYAQVASTWRQKTPKEEEEEENVKKLIVKYMQKQNLNKNHTEIENMATNDIENFVENYFTYHKSASRSEAVEALKGHVETSLKNLEEEQKSPISNNSQLKPQGLLATELHEAKAEWKELWKKFTEMLTQAEKTYIKTPIVPQEEDEIIELTFTDLRAQKTFSFLTCPTIDDADCFFHAAFTENEEDLDAVTDKAERMRKGLWKSIRKEDEKAKELIPFMAGQYLDLIQNATKKKMPLEEFEQLLPQAVQEAYKQKGWKLGLSEIGKITTTNDVREYMEQLVNEELEFFIPLDSRPFIKFEPAYLLAAQEKKQIRIFVRISNTNKLSLLKTVGNENDPIINLLQSGVHYTRLYTGNKIEKPGCFQIIRNNLTNRAVETLEILKDSGNTTNKDRNVLRRSLNELFKAYQAKS